MSDINNKPSNDPPNEAMLLSKFNTVYRHSVLDILTYYTDIPTDPNPDNNPLSVRDPHESLNNSNGQAPTLINSKSNSSNNISNVKIKSLSLTELVISFKHPLVNMEMLRPIPYPHKCQSWFDVQNQIIEMAQISAKARNLSHIRVSGISYPTSFINLFLIFLVILLPIGFYYPDLLYDTIFANYLPFMLSVKPYHNTIFYATIIIHLLEIYFFMFSRFTKYRVPLDYAIEWTLLTLLDGFNTIKRFNNYVKTISPNDVYYDFTNNDYFL